MKRRWLLAALLLAVCLLTLSSDAAPIAVVSVHKNPDGVTLKLMSGTMRLRIFSPGMVEVIYAPGDLPRIKSFSVIAQPERTHWKLAETRDEIALGTDELTVRLNRASGAVAFYDRSGQLLLAEKSGGGKSLTPVHIGGVDTWRSEQVFELPPDEAVYGLGQHPGAPMNYRGAKVHLQQENRDVAVPMLLSSRIAHFPQAGSPLLRCAKS